MYFYIAVDSIGKENIAIPKAFLNKRKFGQTADNASQRMAFTDGALVCEKTKSVKKKKESKATKIMLLVAKFLVSARHACTRFSACVYG